MRIALIHYSAPPIVGGVESVLARHAQLLTDAGHTVRILAARGEPISASIPLISLPLIDSRHPRVMAIKAQLDDGNVPADFAVLTAEITRALTDALSAVDVLIAHNVCSLHKNLALTAAIQQIALSSVTPSEARGLLQSQEIPRYARNDTDKKLRTILWHHDLAWTTPRYRAELHDGYPWDLLRTDWGARHVVVSELRQRELADLLHIPLESVSVVPNGIDLLAFFKLGPITLELLKRLDLSQAAPILLLPVRLTSRKNIELALRTLAVLRRDLPQAKLIVTGPLGAHNPANAAYFEDLKVLRARLNLSTSAIFLAELNAEQPSTARRAHMADETNEVELKDARRSAQAAVIPAYLPDDVIADFYRLADALFLPSREEGFGLPLLEAGLSRLPVFCTDIEPLTTLGGKEVTTFSPDADPEDVARLMTQHLQSDAHYQFAARIRQHYAWEEIYRQKIAPLLEGA